MKREDGFYWVQYHGNWEVAQWEGNGWWFTGGAQHPVDGDTDAIGPRVQRDSEVVRQRDELVAATRRMLSTRDLGFYAFSGWHTKQCGLVQDYQHPRDCDCLTGDLKKIIARIEAEKSGVVGCKCNEKQACPACYRKLKGKTYQSLEWFDEINL
jgi:hypothetical protein